MKMRSNEKVEVNKPALKSIFAWEYMHPDMILFNIWCHQLSHWALLCTVHSLSYTVQDVGRPNFVSDLSRIEDCMELRNMQWKEMGAQCVLCNNCNATHWCRHQSMQSRAETKLAENKTGFWFNWSVAIRHELCACVFFLFLVVCSSDKCPDRPLHCLGRRVQQTTHCWGEKCWNVFKQKEDNCTGLTGRKD